MMSDIYMSDRAVCELRREHLSQVAEIERLCFSEPWSESSLGLLLGGRDRVENRGGVGFVCLLPDGEGQTVCAYGGMICVLDEGQITNIATHPEYRRKGLGRCIVEALVGYARQNGLATISLEVRESNTAAIDLYKKFGFEVLGRRPKFYKAPTEAALIMALKVR